jgi:hypothetical protein
MDKYTDPLTYEAALKRSMKPTEYVMDGAKFQYSEKPDDVLERVDKESANHKPESSTPTE